MTWAVHLLAGPLLTGSPVPSGHPPRDTASGADSVAVMVQAGTHLRSLTPTRGAVVQGDEFLYPHVRPAQDKRPRAERDHYRRLVAAAARAAGAPVKGLTEADLACTHSS